MATLFNLDSAPAATLMFIAIVAALTAALVMLLCVLEQSPRLLRARQIMLRVIDGKAGVKQMRRNRDK